MASSIRDSQRELMARRRASERDLKPPPIKDLKRRLACEADDAEWLRVYVGDVFTYPFTPDHLRNIETLGHCLRYGTKKCIAGPRGEAKTSHARYLVTKYGLQGTCPFAVFIGASDSKADESEQSIRNKLATYRRRSPLVEDYPFECAVAQYLQTGAAKAKQCTANGWKVHCKWSGDEIILPSICEDDADADELMTKWRITPGKLGAILMFCGIFSTRLQGANKLDVRPSILVHDDLDDRESTSIELGTVAAKIHEILSKTVAGMEGMGKAMGQAMLCTVPSENSVAFKYSDPAQMPAWQGERIKRLKAMPTNMQLWEQFIELRNEGKQRLGGDGRPVDPFGRTAHQFYLDRREEMDAGAIVCNEHNYKRTTMPDGSEDQASSLEACFVYIADYGWDSFNTEHQQDPPRRHAVIDTGITIRRVQRQVSGYPERVIPSGCTTLVQAIDVGKYVLHWAVRAFDESGTGFTIEYGTTRVAGTRVGTDEGLDEGIRQAILQRFGEIEERPYLAADEPEQISLTLVDCRYCKQAVCLACVELSQQGQSVFPAMGCGSSAGMLGRSHFTAHKTKTKTVLPGDGWYLERDESGFWIVMTDTDRWKRWEHNRWMTSPDRPGALLLWGEPGEQDQLSVDQRNHYSYAAHINAEKEVDEVVRGVLKRHWKKTEANHWLDASYNTDVAAAMRGVPLLGMQSKATLPQNWGPSGSSRNREHRPTAAELARGGA